MASGHARGLEKFYIRKIFFMERVAKHCSRLHRDVVESPWHGSVQQTRGCGTWGHGLVVNVVGLG